MEQALELIDKLKEIIKTKNIGFSKLNNSNLINASSQVIILD